MAAEDMMTMELNGIENLFRSGYFAAIDYHFARFVARNGGCGAAPVQLAAALVSRQAAAGHVCLDLAEYAGAALSDATGKHAVTCPEPAAWREQLAQSSCIGRPGDRAPLILDDNDRLYLYRLHRLEQELARRLRNRAARTDLPADTARLAERLARLFPESGSGLQRLAAFSAAVKPLCVVCGGPGTGKTTTAARMLALLREQAAAPARMVLCAPTGKAADRLQKAVGAVKSLLPCAPAVLADIPDTACTLHRLLGMRPDRPQGSFSENNPLPHDVIVVDEASMVDLPMMARLFLAARPDAKVILLGDRNQLASVAPGAVLGDVCRAGVLNGCSESLLETYRLVAGAPPPCAAAPEGGVLIDCLHELTRNYRFAGASGIGRLAVAVSRGDAAAALEMLNSSSLPDIAWTSLPDPDLLPRSLGATVVDGYRPFLQAAHPAEALQQFDRFRILCALREGPWGVHALNVLAQRLLAAEGLVDDRSAWYAGRPVMITSNNHRLQLYNGDVGITCGDGQGGPLVCFSGPDGGVRTFAPEQLPAHETAYAVTVHKAQGSEFARALLLLPDRPSPVLTRELIYTGITRVREHVSVWGAPAVFAAAVAKTLQRSSGLYDALRLI